MDLNFYKNFYKAKTIANGFEFLQNFLKSKYNGSWIRIFTKNFKK